MVETHLKNVSFNIERLKESKAYDPLKLARVVNQQRGIYLVDLDHEIIHAKVSGKMMHQATDVIDFPSVGDYVMVEKNQDTTIIHHILKRNSILERKSAGKTADAQVIATNIDYILICMSLNENFNLRRLERYLSISWMSGAIPVIVLTKFDLYNPATRNLELVYSVSSGADVIITSELIEPYYDELEAIIKKGMTYALIGSSGVGKSTIINHLIGTKVTETKDIGYKDRGRHVTTSRELFETKEHAYIIDTPGMRELQLDDVDLASTFDDIEALGKSCKFNDCKHEKEPGCKVIEAIDNGIITKERLRSYKTLLKEYAYQKRRQKQKERKFMKASK